MSHYTFIHQGDHKVIRSILNLHPELASGQDMNKAVMVSLCISGLLRKLTMTATCFVITLFCRGFITCPALAMTLTCTV